MRYLRIRNWGKWQTFRSDRGKPPWIKLYRSLANDENWLLMTDAQRGQLTSLWIYAGSNDGWIPADPAMCRKVASLDAEPDLELFISMGWFLPLGVSDEDTASTDGAADGSRDGVTVASPCQPSGCQDDAPVPRARARLCTSDPLISDPLSSEGEPEEEGDPPRRAREAVPGVVQPVASRYAGVKIVRAADYDQRPGPRRGRPVDMTKPDLEVIRCSEAQLLMLHSKAERIGRPLEEIAASIGVPIVGLYVDKLLGHLDQLIAELKPARASPKSIAELNAEQTNRALEEYQRRSVQ